MIFFDAGELESDSLRKVITKHAKSYEGDMIFAEVNVKLILFRNKTSCLQGWLSILEFQ